jgi:hypothetical protein
MSKNSERYRVPARQTGSIEFSLTLPTDKLVAPHDKIDFSDSRKRVIAILDDLRTFVGEGFSIQQGQASTQRVRRHKRALAA